MQMLLLLAGFEEEELPPFTWEAMLPIVGFFLLLIGLFAFPFIMMRKNKSE